MLRQGAFTCVGWQVILCDPIWQVTLCSSEMGSHEKLHTSLILCLMKTDVQNLDAADRSEQLKQFIVNTAAVDEATD